MSRRRDPDPHAGGVPAERTFAEGYYAGWGDAVEALVRRGVLDRAHVLSGETQEAMLDRARARGLEPPGGAA